MTDLEIKEDDIGNKLHGKTAIVTGGSSGIGLGVVEYFTKHGVEVLNGDIREPPSVPSGAHFQKTDASDWYDLLALFKKAIELWGRIDIVIPNAGIIDGDMKHTDDAGDPVKPEFAALKLNLIGQMYTVKLAMHYMRKQQPQGGVIVSTVSRDGYEAVGLPAYAASKHGMIGLMRALKRGSMQWNVRINSIAPSVTDSAMTRFIPTVIPDCQRAGIPVSTREDTAKAIALLAVDEKYNGHTISVDGQTYRELEGGFERYTTDILGTHTEKAMTKEQLDVMSKSPRDNETGYHTDQGRWHRFVYLDVVSVLVDDYSYAVSEEYCVKYLQHLEQRKIEARLFETDQGVRPRGKSNRLGGRQRLP